MNLKNNNNENLKLLAWNGLLVIVVVGFFSQAEFK
jgi:hypothetical protein